MSDSARAEVQHQIRSLPLDPAQWARAEYAAVLVVATAEAMGLPDEELLTLRGATVFETVAPTGNISDIPVLSLVNQFLLALENSGSREIALSQIREGAYDPKWVAAFEKVEALVQPITG